ncbi:MAG: primase-helicase family protein, partial [Gammaproteobacteria bacterium]
MANPCPLKKLQKRFCILDLNGEFRLLDSKQVNDAKSGIYSGDISFYKKSDGVLKMERFLEELPINFKPKDVIANFWINPFTKVYKQTAFSPNTSNPDTLNYWVPHTIKPLKNDFNIIERYLLEIICDDHDSSYAYLIKFLAHMLQKPEEKPGIVPVLIGGQGTGKGVFFQLLKAIWSKTTLLVSNIDEVVGKFNAALERNYIICMDEALFSGDRKSLDRLKSTVTESTIRIEQKYQPSRTIESFHRFFAATNHDHFAHIDNDDRRFFFLRVSSSHQQDSKYFSELCASFSDGKTLEGFVDYLLKLDLSDFNVRQRPKTNEHIKQIINSFKKFERYWCDVLNDGVLDRREFGNDVWSSGVFIST